MKDPIIILHGWGSQMDGVRYSGIREIFEANGFSVFAPDLPGFGKNVLQKEALSFDDYILFVKEFIEKRKLKRVILLGHSFGGRIAIAFTAKYPELVSRLILVNASGIPHALPSGRKKVAYITTKILKPVFLIPPFSFFFQFFRKIVYYSIGEMDYYKSGNLHKTFKNVYHVDITKDLEKITKPTCIVWGEKDSFTPLSDGKYMHKKIRNSKLMVIKNATHKLPYENPKLFAREVLSFIG